MVKIEDFLISADLSLAFARIVNRSPIMRRILPVVQNKVARILYIPVVCPRRI
jgi:hypothetical protein